MIKFTREQITQMSWQCYCHITETHGAGDWDQTTDTVSWPISQRSFSWLVLQYPELGVADAGHT